MTGKAFAKTLVHVASNTANQTMLTYVTMQSFGSQCWILQERGVLQGLAGCSALMMVVPSSNFLRILDLRRHFAPKHHIGVARLSESGNTRHTATHVGYTRIGCCKTTCILKTLISQQQEGFRSLSWVRFVANERKFCQSVKKS